MRRDDRGRLWEHSADQLLCVPLRAPRPDISQTPSVPPFKASSKIRRGPQTPTCVEDPLTSRADKVQYQPAGFAQNKLATGYTVLLQCRYTDVCSGVDSFICEWAMNGDGSAGSGVRRNRRDHS